MESTSCLGCITFEKGNCVIKNECTHFSGNEFYQRIIAFNQSDQQRLLSDLIKYVEGNYEVMIGIDRAEGYFTMKTDEEVFVVSVRKDSLEDWGY